MNPPTLDAARALLALNRVAYDNAYTETRSGRVFFRTGRHYTAVWSPGHYLHLPRFPMLDIIPQRQQEPLDLP